MDTKTKTKAGAAIGGKQTGVNRKSGRTQRSTAEKDTVVGSSSPKSAKGARSSRSSRINSGALVCRYCSSDDLALSFKKRRDARCRACFKKRYGAKAKGQKSKRPGKAKASK
jgi:hypothetical protein